MMIVIIYKFVNLIFSPVETEVWNIENRTYEVINPTLAYGHYAFGIALYSVDPKFCANY